MKRFRNLLLILILLIGTVCYAYDSYNEEYLNNVENCTQGKYGYFEVEGFDGDFCIVKMISPLPPNTEMDAYVFTYAFPRDILSEMVSDSKNLSEDDFKKKWRPREEEFCRSIKYGNKTLYTK